jgi:putative SOS response-associated peptidase YedK
VASKPSFRVAFRHRRCLLPADGFYEWKAEGKKKHPYHCHLQDGQVFAFAGLWEEWQRGGEAISTCTILTTSANDLLVRYHDRMPVILPPPDYSLWLDKEVQDPKQLEALLRPYPSAAMAAVAVSDWVNNPRHDGPQCVRVNA